MEGPFPDELAPEIRLEEEEEILNPKIFLFLFLKKKYLLSRPLYKKMRDLLAPLTLRILEAISVSLGLDRNFLPDLHKKLLTKGNRSDMRSLYYPAIKGDIFSKPYCEKMKHAGFF